MTVYAFGLTSTDIDPEFPNMATFGATTKPTSTQVNVWIQRYAGQVLVRLEAIGAGGQDDMPSLISSTANKAQYEALRDGIVRGIVDRVHVANQEEDTTLAEDHRSEWREFILSIEGKPWTQLGGVEATGRTFKTDKTSDRVTRPLSFD